MAFEKLTDKEQKVVLEVMKLLLNEEQYIPSWEFQTRLGVTRDQMRQVIAQWPHLNDDNDAGRKDNSDLVRVLAINNSLNEVLHGIHVSEAVWSRWISESKDEVKRVFKAWRAYEGWPRWK